LTHDFGDFLVDSLEHLDAVGISEPDPQFIVVVQVNCLRVEFELSVVAFKPILVFRNIRLVVVVVHDRRNQVETPVKD
jgi:hypothetical protein